MNIYKWVYKISVILLLILSACQDKKIVYTLTSAGDNKTELEKVLSHYKNNDKRHKAAYFLIQNMSGHNHYDSATVKHFQPYYDTLRSISIKHDWKKTSEWKEETEKYWDGVKKEALSFPMKMEKDIHTIKSNQLIEEIDLAFKAWQENAYSRSIRFEEFCQYILPYRIHNGLRINDSRSNFYRDNAGYFANNKQDFRIKVDSLLYRYNDLVHNEFTTASLPLLSIDAFEYIKRGSCDDRCKFNIVLLSALGMPVVHDFVPAWGNRHNSHGWNAIILDGESYPFEAFWDEDRWKYKELYKNKSSDPLWGKFRLPKVYRHTYEINITGPLGEKNIRREDIPPLFLNPFIKDVSSQYFDCADVKTEITAPLLRDVSYCYLCVFGVKEWQPVQWGKINGNDKNVIFKNMGKDIVYLPAFYQDGHLIPASSAFLLTQEGVCKKLIPGKKKISITIKSATSDLAITDVEWTKKMLADSYIIGNDKPDIFSSDTLLHLTEDMDMWENEKKIEKVKAYKYIGLVAPDDSLGLCEISFYEQGKDYNPVENVKLSANIKPLNPSENVNMIIDHLSVTGCVCEIKGENNTLWFDLGTSRVLSKIKYIPYTKSFLCKNKDIELYYWDGDWKFAGIVKNNIDEYVTFDEVPQGTIYKIRINGQHKQTDRIFTYENGVLCWY